MEGAPGLRMIETSKSGVQNLNLPDTNLSLNNFAILGGFGMRGQDMTLAINFALQSSDKVRGKIAGMPPDQDQRFR